MSRRRRIRALVRVYAITMCFVSAATAAASSEPALSRKAFEGLSAFSYRVSGSVCLLPDKTGQEITYAVGAEVDLIVEKGRASQRAIRIRCARVLLDLMRGEKGEVMSAWILAR